MWLRSLLRGCALGVVAGLLAGPASFVLLEALDLATETRLEHGWLLFLLPAAGAAIGAAYHHLGGRSAEGNALLLEQIHTPADWVPRRLAPFVLVGTVAGHLFGASVGREGTALQMAGSLADGGARAVRLPPADRRRLLTAALAGGFGSVFGVPAAGAVFAIEVVVAPATAWTLGCGGPRRWCHGRFPADAIVPAVVAAVVGDLVVGVLGHEHPLRPAPTPALGAGLLAGAALAGVAFALAATVFVEVTHHLRSVAVRRLPYPPVRTAVGGAAVVGLAALFGRDHLGLSLPLIDDALAGQDMAIWVPVLKVVFTAVSLGCGFPGGEVTPLFVVGATLGAGLGDPLGLDPVLLAAVGFVAVFGSAAGTPLACVVMAVEVFGLGVLAPAAVTCVVAHALGRHRGIYGRGPAPGRRADLRPG